MAKKIENRLNKGDILDQALSEWRESKSDRERFSGPTRERILGSIQSPEYRFELGEALGSLFFPVRRFALAAVVPSLVLVLALGYALMPGRGADPGLPLQVTQITQMEVTRVGDDVVFRIANGTRTHLVYKSSDINELSRATPVAVSDGVFRDTVHAEANLVFYRVD
jgi:hypothetical protein